MEAWINGSKREIPDHVSVAELLSSLGLAGKACAVEVNQQLVPKREHEGRRLAAGDKIEVVTLVGGG